MMKNKENNVYVTKPTLPNLNELIPYLEQIWDSKIITNNGKFHQQLEKELAEYLGVKYISLFSNCTLGLMTALQTLRVTGEVITTPFTFVATANSILWNGLKPVFVDVDIEKGNIDVSKIEAAITKDTTAILPVHVYGNCCNVDEIQDIAEKFGLKIIYDAAHAFGIKYNKQSILNYGDLSVLSFHATKIYNTIEGGAIVCHDKKTKKRIDYLKNFGFENETKIVAPGLNAKMNELQSVYGLLQLKAIDENIEKRKNIAALYTKELNEIKGIRIFSPENIEQHTYPYYPILVDGTIFKMTRDELYEYLKSKNIFCRRYFYPLVSSFSMYKSLESAKSENLTNANRLAEQIICLPIYPDLDANTIKKICKLIKG